MSKENPELPAARSVLAAMARTLESRLDLVATAVFTAGPAGPTLCLATGPLADASRLRALEAGIAAALSDPLAANETRRLDPSLLPDGLPFAALHPIGDGTGFLLVAAGRPRKIGARLHGALIDASQIAAPLIREASRRAARPVAPGRSPFEPGVLSRGDAEDRALRFLSACDPETPITALAVAIDRFNVLGAAGDPVAAEAVLAVAGARLQGTLGPGDRLLRLEGDRFLILAIGGAAEARLLAQRALSVIGQPFVRGTQRLLVQASIGVATAQAGSADIAGLVEQAETALGRAKDEGRNRAAFHEPRLEAAHFDRSQLAIDLQQALALGQMRLAYQPYTDLATGSPSGAEALLRWRHPDRGDVPPSTFIPLAEASGLILPLGFWALRAACTAAADWPAHLTLSVNVSPLMFHEPGFVGEVLGVLATSGLPPERLELEITETVLMRDSPETTAQLETLIAHGIRVALDDFGTGYSALAYLSRLPHHRIKLDRSFVRDFRNAATAELIRAIVALARRNGVGITAEGIERPEELQAARAFGFTHVQGFATGPPGSVGALLAQAAAPS